jgi:hypothetical protein
MSRIGEPVVVANPPPLPPTGDGPVGVRAAKIGSKSGQSRSRAREVSGSGGLTPTSDTPPPSERADSTALNREGSFDNEVDDQRHNRRTLGSPVTVNGSGELPQVNGTAAPIAVHTSGGAPKAVRRLRDTTAGTTGPALVTQCSPACVQILSHSLPALLLAFHGSFSLAWPHSY